VLSVRSGHTVAHMLLMTVVTLIVVVLSNATCPVSAVKLKPVRSLGSFILCHRGASRKHSAPNRKG